MSIGVIEQTMQKLSFMLLALALVLSGLLSIGCSRAPAQGKLQVMYSGNIKGNVAPCG